MRTESLLTQLEHQGADSRNPLAQTESRTVDYLDPSQDTSQPGTLAGTDPIALHAPESSRSGDSLQSNPDSIGQPTDREMESMSPAALTQCYVDITQVVDHDEWS